MRISCYYLCLLLLLTACSTPPKSSEIPDVLPDSLSWQKQSGMYFEMNHTLLELIKDEDLKRVVQLALDNNHDLKATALRLEAQSLLLSETRSRMLPSVGVGINKQRGNEGLDTETLEYSTKNDHKTYVALDWELDLWGKLRDERRAGLRQFESEQWHYKLARDVLATRVVEAWINVIAYKNEVQIQKERLNAISDMEAIIRKRYEKGLGDLSEIAAARSKRNLAEADYAGAEESARRSMRSLELLLGKVPQANLVIGRELPAIDMPPQNIPIDSLKRRPDVRAALATFEASHLVASSAHKDKYPSLSLSGNVSKSSVDLGDLSSGKTLWNILGSLTLPVYSGDRIQDTAEARDLEATAELLNLKQVLLKALKEAEDAYGREQELCAQERLFTQALTESVKSRDYFEQRYKKGLGSILDLLSAREEEMEIKSRLNSITAERISNRVSLVLALGISLEN